MIIIVVFDETGQLLTIYSTFAIYVKKMRILFNFVSDYAIRMFQINHDGLKLNGTYQHFIYADDVNILGGRV